MTQDPRDQPVGGPDDAARADPVLRRMLDEAPDRDAAPHPATREAIRKIAHHAVAPSPLAVKPAEPARPWWQRLWQPGPGARMPWNAAFATVLVAVLLTVLWHREPVPDAQLDAGAPQASSSAPAPAPRAEPPAAVAPPPMAETAPAAPQAAARGAASTADSHAAETKEQRRRIVQAAPRGKSEDGARARADAPASVAPAEKLAPAPLAPPAAPAPSVAASAAPMAARPAPVAPAPSAAAIAPAPTRESAAPAALARRQAAPAAPPGAWHGWTHLRIADAGGQVQRLSRAEAGQLAALVEAVIPTGPGMGEADAAVAPAWRLTLESGDGALGVLEVPAAPTATVRWREGAAPAVGAAPPAAVLQALRQALAGR